MCVRKKYAEEDGVSTGSLMGVLCNWTATVQAKRGQREGRVDSLLLVTPIYSAEGKAQGACGGPKLDIICAPGREATNQNATNLLHDAITIDKSQKQRGISQPAQLLKKRNTIHPKHPLFHLHDGTALNLVLTS